MDKKEQQRLGSVSCPDVPREAISADADAFCLIFDADEWLDEQDRLTLHVPLNYALVACVPQQDGAISFEGRDM